jgi:hypothetical protein
MLVSPVFRYQALRLSVALGLTDLAQQLAHVSGGAQFTADIGGEAKLALRIEPTGLDIGREFAHDLGKRQKDPLELLGIQLSLPRHAGASAVQRTRRRPTVA